MATSSASPRSPGQQHPHPYADLHPHPHPHADPSPTRRPSPSPPPSPLHIYLSPLPSPFHPSLSSGSSSSSSSSLTPQGHAPTRSSMRDTVAHASLRRAEPRAADVLRASSPPVLQGAHQSSFWSWLRLMVPDERLGLDRSTCTFLTPSMVIDHHGMARTAEKEHRTWSAAA